jgi:hypothetical protein
MNRLGDHWCGSLYRLRPSYLLNSLMYQTPPPPAALDVSHHQHERCAGSGLVRETTFVIVVHISFVN